MEKLYLSLKGSTLRILFSLWQLDSPPDVPGGSGGTNTSGAGHSRKAHSVKLMNGFFSGISTSHIFSNRRWLQAIETVESATAEQGALLCIQRPPQSRRRQLYNGFSNKCWKYYIKLSFCERYLSLSDRFWIGYWKS